MTARHSVRFAEPGDVDAIAEVHIAARREAMPWLPVLHTDVETRAWVAAVVMPHQEVWVAEVDGQVAGYATLDGAELNDLYMQPGYQRRGVGTALLRKAMERSAGELLLWTFQRNAGARQFCERHGFSVVELTDGAANEEREPDVRYHWFRPQ